MGIKELFRFLHHISKVISNGGPKRVAYAIGHILMIVLTALAFYAVYWLASNCGDILANNGFFAFVFSIIGLCICAVFGLICFLQGVIAQLVLIIVSAIELKKNPQERGSNLAAMIIGILSFIAIAVVLIVLFTVIL